MEDQFSVHEYLQLYTTPDKFYLKPAQQCCNSSEVFVIDRMGGECCVKDIDLVKLLGTNTDYKLIFGFLGTIKLISELYLVAVTDRILLGKLYGHNIYKVASTEIIPLTQSSTHLSSQQIKDNATYERMILLMLELPGAYFSCTYDLTHTLQNLLGVPPGFLQKSLVDRADTRFVWNRNLLKDFSNEQFGRFTLPLIQGFVSINPVTVNGHKLVWSLVSRRCVERIGTRLFMRGIDAQGNVANHVVTEQIIEYDTQIASFVITRGSVPVPWTQYPDLKFIPTLNIAKGDHVTGLVKHLANQQERYGNVVCVNLISQHGQEGVLEKAYRDGVTAANLPNVKYYSFDFHAECSSFRYDKIAVFVDSLADELSHHSYFFTKNGAIIHHQSGMLRLNCLDCLDRTNVAQNILANILLKTMLIKLGVAKDDKELSQLEVVVNNVWADHADIISMQYSGTRALKTDFTRTGKRTYVGIIDDSINAVIRYYKNNFSDGFRQDAFDLFLGNYVITNNKNSKRNSSRRYNCWKCLTFLSVLLIAIFMFCASIFLSENYATEMFLYLMFWGTLAVVTVSYMFRNGKEFVDWPRLCIVERMVQHRSRNHYD